jgi:hypothetical protein
MNQILVLQAAHLLPHTTILSNPRAVSSLKLRFENTVHNEYLVQYSEDG